MLQWCVRLLANEGCVFELNSCQFPIEVNTCFSGLMGPSTMMFMLKLLNLLAVAIYL